MTLVISLARLFSLCTCAAAGGVDCELTSASGFGCRGFLSPFLGRADVRQELLGYAEDRYRIGASNGDLVKEIAADGFHWHLSTD